MQLDTLRPLFVPLALSFAFSACAIADDEPDGPSYDPDDACFIAGRYDDGTCDTDCPDRDIDCFLVFDDHAAADAWFADFESLLAAEQRREPRRLVSEDDPRFVRMREMLDRGWDSYRAVAPVGLLDQPPELVVIEDPNINAFATIDLATAKSAFVVMVQTGLLDSGIMDHELLGVVMHELEHAVGLHVVPGVKDLMRKHYQVLGGPEPFGFEQSNDELAEEVIATWRILADQASPYPRDVLEDLPMNESVYHRVLRLAHSLGSNEDAAACARADQASMALDAFINMHRSRFDLELDITGEEQQARELADAYFAALRDECLAATTLTIYDVYAVLAGSTPEVIEQSFPPEDKELVADKHVVDAIRALTAARHQTMSLVEQVLIDMTGGGLATMRYYSYEEAADDRAVEVLADAGLPADGNGGFLLSVMKPADQQRCTEILDAGQVPPYGNLGDDHHGTCWRVFHTRALAARDDQTARSLVALQPDRVPAAVNDAIQVLRDIRRVQEPLLVPSLSDHMTSCFHGSH